ncbi:MAG: hypothetical protein LBB91_01605 [Clostridiales bacterium]|jgi:uncharacterized repeat protein (TIGR02543 family)|nr:hypothetical protein [Clostridiales bacterium]
MNKSTCKRVILVVLMTAMIGTLAACTAQLEAESYTVTFKTGSLGVMTPEEYSEEVSHNGKFIRVPSITAASGYTFAGWLMNEGDTYYSDSDILEMSMTENTVFTAQYHEITGHSGESTQGPPQEQATLIVYAIDKATNKVIYEQSLPVILGYRLNLNAPRIAGYTLDTDSSVILDVMIDRKVNTVNFYYNLSDSESLENSDSSDESTQGLLIATLTVFAIDKATNEVISEDSSEVIIGESENILASAIEGYTLAADSPAMQTIAINPGVNMLYFYYNADGIGE